MFKLMRRPLVVLVLGILLSVAVPFHGAPASAQMSDAAPAATTEVVTLTPQAFGDWRDNIAPLYKAGWPIQVGTFDLGGGRMFTPTVIRVQRNGFWFAVFSLPTGRTFALNESDGAIYHAPNFADPSGWTLADEEQLAQDISALWAILQILGTIAVLAIALAGLVLGIVFILMILTGGGSGRNQITDHVYLGDYRGATREWDNNPTFRGALNNLHPKLVQQGYDFGIFGSGF